MKKKLEENKIVENVPTKQSDILDEKAGSDVETFKCSKCKFGTNSKKGLNIYLRKKMEIILVKSSPKLVISVKRPSKVQKKWKNT